MSWLVVCLCLAVAQSASSDSALADYVGLVHVTKADADTVSLCNNANGENVPDPLDICNVFAQFSDPTDRLLSVGFADITASNGLYFQHPLNVTPISPLCEAIPDFPDLICDSFVTLGLKCGPAPAEDGSYPDPDFLPAEFAANGHVVGGWFNIAFAGAPCPEPCTPETCPTDIDGDCAIGTFDLALVLGCWGPCACPGCPGDFNGDGTVNPGDLAFLLGTGEFTIDQGLAGNYPGLQVLFLQLSVATGGSITGTISVFAKINGDTIEFPDQFIDCFAAGGECQGPEDCADDDACTEDTCNDGFCLNDPVDCSGAGDQCNAASCDSNGEDGNCDILTPLPNGTECSDGNSCNVGETCSAGSCTGGDPQDCSGAGGECNTASCDPDGAEGNCDDLTPVKNGEPCEDGDACTENDMCSGGECVADPIDCAPGEACVDGECVHIWHVDDDGDPKNGCTSWNDACPDLQTALSLATAGDQIWVAAGVYKPSDCGGGKCLPEHRVETFQLINDVGIYGGFFGNELTLKERAGLFDQTILSGDLSGNDIPVPCEGPSPACDAFGEVCGDDGFCIIADDNGENSYHVTTGSGTAPTAILDGFAITGGNADEAFPFDRGGGMRNDAGSPTLTNCTFNGNRADLLGGGMSNRNGSSPTLTNCNFNGNASWRGGGMYNDDSSPTLTDCTISGNSASQLGGGIYVQNSSPTLTNCTFSENVAANWGGGMWNGGGTSLTNCTFSANTAPLGGGMLTSGVGSTTLTDCTFSENVANHGGGIVVQNSSPTLTDCTFSGNSASQLGGGMIMGSASSPALTDCTFSGNTAAVGGGGMAIDGNASPTVTSCIFSGNSTDDRGGGMEIHDSSPTVTNCTFSGNSAHRGGGMHNKRDSSPSVTNCTFSGNSAFEGAGMYNVEGATPMVTDCTFTGNAAAELGGLGGGMSNALDSHPTATNCTFSGNSADRGGGMSTSSADATVTNCTFSGNTATSVGGGMYNSTGDPTVTNCTFSGNSASVLGGGMYNFQNGNPTVTNCVLWDNTGGSFGGSGSPTVTYSDVEGGFAGDGNIDADPILVRDPDPGPDGDWGTDDDDHGDLRLQADSPAIDAADNTAVPLDTIDLDGDGDTAEPIPFDLDGEARFVDRLSTPDTGNPGFGLPIVDMGAYEFGSDCNDNGIPDACDIDCGAKGGKCDPKTCGQSDDCNGNDVPDECEPDCNENGIPDDCDIDGGGSTDCDGGGVPDECEIPPIGPDENDCNENGVHDACDILDGDSDDCNGNGTPDECEIDENSPAPGGPFFCMENCDPDCDDNGIPDKCDIANCPPEDAACQDCDGNGEPDECQLPESCDDGICTIDCDLDCDDNCIIDACDIAECVDDPNCDDCNLNGAPDVCDDPDGLPDECIEPVEKGQNWTDDIWGLPGDDPYPDNQNGAPELHVTLEGESINLLLDDTVVIETLRLLDGATLRITEAKTGDFTVADPGGILVEGNLLVANDRMIDATAGTVTIGPGGVYRAEDPEDPELQGTLEAGNITVQGGLPPLDGGSLTLSGFMGVVVNGDLQTAEEDDDKGCDAPPDLSSTGNAQVRVMGTLDIGKCVEVDISSSQPVILDGDMQNQSTFPSRFDWDAGGLQMNGTSQTIEAAGEDRGPWPIGLEDNFVIGTLTLVENAVVQVVDEFDNQQDGLIACDEALYIDTLIVGPGAVLLTDGCRVYYNTLNNNGGAVPGLGSDVLQIRTPIPADLNGDGKVGPFDLALLLGAWGPCLPPCAPEGEPDTCPESCTPEDHMEICREDISGDCKVGPFDLAQLLGSWGPVPE